MVPLSHLLICFIIDITGTGGSWDWFLLSFVDFPVVVTLDWMQVPRTSFVTFSVLGTLWWLAISLVLRHYYRKIVL